MPRNFRALTALLCFALSVSALALSSPAAAASTTIKVATYNVCAEKCPKLVTWSTRSARVVASIADQKPDVVLIQEAGTSDYHARILKKRMATAGYAAATGTHARYLFYRTRTMTKYSTSGTRLDGGTTTVRGTTTSRLQYVPWHVLRKRGTASYTLFVDLHLTVGKSDALDLVRLAELKKVWAKLAGRLSKSPIIWGGDLNSLAEDADPKTKRCGSWELRWRVDAYLQSKAHLDAVFKAATLLTPPISTVNHDPTRETYECAGQQIDHLYSDSRLGVSTWRTVNRNVAYKDQFSDHDMVVATFTR